MGKAKKGIISNCSLMGAGPVEIGCANFRSLDSVPCHAVCQMLILSGGYFVKVAIDLLQNGDRRKCWASLHPLKLQTMEIKRAKRTF